jgi:hypothetical protein
MRAPPAGIFLSSMFRLALQLGQETFMSFLGFTPALEGRTIPDEVDGCEGWC